ncbi:tannase and feruloyl esterase [Dactylonectria estremocensis]|uniref:Carboxylic ester hydrolase n=1 Tax=Dactylonectria estremocensis TaxID=1079267 RepID=A0A9P9ERS0_9HYPO|nr:tannase and feruloyl esterase [Dactylonectria estremocensis]
MSLDWLLQEAANPGQWIANLAGGSVDPCNPAAISLPAFPDLKVLSLEAIPRENYTFISEPGLGGPQDPITGLNFCNITVSYTHPGWDDNIVVTTYLPSREKWNGRLMANGGGGFVTGGAAIVQFTMIPGLVEGYAVTTTDGGHVSDITDAYSTSSSWALSSPGNINWPLLVDFASVALHDMSTVSKAVIKAFYEKEAKYSYFYGGSTGGRQGHMLAQRYPKDFNGLVALMPAINWTRFLWANIWPTFLMDKLGIYPRPCELNAMTNAAITFCDPLDGVEDGIISRPDLCNFDPHDVVGNEFECDGVTSTFTSGAATIAKAAWDGPRSSTGQFQWHGFTYETNISQIGIGPAVTKCDEDGEDCDAVPFAISHVWAKYWLLKDPDFDMRKISHEKWDELFHDSVSQYSSIMNTDDPDLSGLRKAGNKMINWHGMADQAIPVNGSVDYYERVLAHDPNAQDYYRFFLAPGGEHCYFCAVVPPIMKMMDIMVDWVEKDVAPETLPVVGDNRHGIHLERNICMYPRVQHYTGGDMASPSAFKCV